MKKLIRFIAAAFAVTILMSLISPSMAYADSGSTIIDDKAGLFTSEQSEKLNAKMQKISQKYDYSVVLLTVPSTNNIYSTTYINDYYDVMYEDLHKISKDCIFIFRDIDERILEIRAYGECQKFLPNKRCEKVIDKMARNIMRDQYYEGFLTGLDQIKSYLLYHPNPMTWTLVQILIAVVVAAIVVASMVRTSESRITTNANTYLDISNSGIVAKRDVYYNTTVTRTRINTSSSSGGSHSSSGGRSTSSRGHSSSGARRRI